MVKKTLLLAMVMVLLTVSVSLLNLPLLQASDGSGMENYINKVYGYAISFPQGWKVDDSDPSAVGSFIDEVTRTAVAALVKPRSELPGVTSAEDLETFTVKQMKEDEEVPSLEVISSKKVRQVEKFPGREVLF